MERRRPESSYFLTFTEACGTSRDGRKLLARDRICSQVPCKPWYRPRRDARLRPDTPLARAARPLGVESSCFRANVSVKLEGTTEQKKGLSNSTPKASAGTKAEHGGSSSNVSLLES